MPLIDASILSGQQRPDLLGAYQQGIRTRGLLREDNAAEQKAMRMKAFEQAFTQASQGLDLTNAEHMGNVLKQTYSQFPDETAETAKKYAEAFPQAKTTEQGIYESDAGPYAYDKSNPAGTMTPIPGVKPKGKDSGPSAYEIAKDKWEQDYKERTLKASMANTTKDNDLAASKAELARQKLETEMDAKSSERQAKTEENIAQADEMMSLVDQMIGPESKDGALKLHPGFKSAVGTKGASSLWGFREKPLAGTDAAGFMAMYDQVKGGAFLQAVQSMRGTGALSDTEGRAATSAITRMNAATSEADFIRAAQDFRTAIKNRKGRSLARAAEHPSLSGKSPAADSSGWIQAAPGIRMREKKAP